MNDSQTIHYKNVISSPVSSLVTALKPVGTAEYVSNTVTIHNANDGVTTNTFFANSNMVKIVADVSATFDAVCIWIGILKQDGTETLYKILDGASPGHLEISFDAANYVVYADAKEFRVILDTKHDFGTMTIHSFHVYQLEGIQQSAYYADSLEPMLKNVFDGLDALQSRTVAKVPTVVSPSGKKFTLAIDDDGKLISIPNIPKKAVFIGNSLLFGMSFYGMCATSSKNDYFYYVTREILAKNPDASFTKIYGSMFEACESKDAFEQWWQEENKGTGKPVKDSFPTDADLVVIQLNDNINNPTRVKAFEKNIEVFLSRIRKASPGARIVWVLGWYNRSNSYAIIADNCAKWNIPIVDISDLNIKENQAESGQSYELLDGTTGIVKDGWITHPGDKGMKKISERIIRALDM